MSSSVAGVEGRRLRVVSLLPSATEMLCGIEGGACLLVGRSHADNYPESIVELPVLTGKTTVYTTAEDLNRQVAEASAAGQSLWTLNAELLKSLRPDVILTQDICALCAIDSPTVEKIAVEMDPRPKVISLNPMCLEDVLQELVEIGEAVGLKAEGEQARANLQARALLVDKVVEAGRSGKETDSLESRPTVALFEWTDPLYVAGHWTPEIVERAGGWHPMNPATRKDGEKKGAGKSFAVPFERLMETDPEYVVICPCGLTLPESMLEAEQLPSQEGWGNLRAVKEGKMVVLDGDAMLNRPGPRLIDALEWLAATLQGRPEVAPRDFPAVWLPRVAAN